MIYTQSSTLYEKIPNAPRSNFNVPPQIKDSCARDSLIGTTNTHHTTASNPTPTFEVNVMSFDKGKSDKQPGSKKKGKSYKKKTSNSQERSSDQPSGPWKPRYPCMICNEEHFVRDCPHCAEVSKIIKTSNASAVLTDSFPNLDTNLVATDPAPSSQVLMLSTTKPSLDILESTQNKDYGSLADQPTTSTMNPSNESVPPPFIPELTIKPPKGVIHKLTYNP